MSAHKDVKAFRIIDEAIGLRMLSNLTKPPKETGLISYTSETLSVTSGGGSSASLPGSTITTDSLLYEILVLKYMVNQLYISTAVMKNSFKQQINALLKTTWTEGFVYWNVVAIAGNPIPTVTTRWKRSWMGVKFDHELSILDPSIPVTAPVSQVYGTSTYDSTNGTMVVTRPSTDSREMADGGQMVEQVNIVSRQVPIAGEFPFDVTFESDNSTVKTFIKQSQYPSAVEEQFTGNGQITNNTTDMQPLSKLPNPTSKKFHLTIQENSESDTAFFIRTFGFQAANYITKNTATTDLISSGDARLNSILACCNYTTTTTNPYPIDTTGSPQLKVETGQVIFGGQINFDGNIDSSDTYSMWANPNCQIQDFYVVSLPSNVINSANVADIITYGSPATPHARVFVNGEVRSYAYPNPPDGTINNMKLIFLNYIKIESQEVGKGFFGRSAPGHAVWILMTPGYSLFSWGPMYRGTAGAGQLFDYGTTIGKQYPTGWLTKQWLSEYSSIAKNNYSNNVGPPISVSPVNWIASLDGGTGFDTTNSIGTAGLLLQYTYPSTLSTAPFLAIIGPSTSDQDTVIFTPLEGNSDTSPGVDVVFYAYGNATITSLSAQSVFPIVTTPISNSILTQNKDATGSTTPDATSFGKYKYGTITYKAYTTSGEIKSLFPPLWYLQTEQGYSPEIRNLQNQINYVKNFLDTYSSLTIKTILTTIQKIGLTNELIAGKIYTLEKTINIRLDLLSQYIIKAVQSLSEMITQNNQSIGQMFGGFSNLTGGFITVFTTIGPAILGAIPVIGGIAGAAANAGTNIATKSYKAAVFAEETSLLVSRGLKLLTTGHMSEGALYALFGTLGAYQLFKGFNLDSNGNIIPDANGNPTANADNVIANTPITDPDLVSFLGNVKPPNPGYGQYDTEGVIADIPAYHTANENLLQQIQSLQSSNTNFPTFDPTAPF